MFGSDADLTLGLLFITFPAKLGLIFLMFTFLLRSRLAANTNRVPSIAKRRHPKTLAVGNIKQVFVSLPCLIISSRSSLKMANTKL